MGFVQFLHEVLRGSELIMGDRFQFFLELMVEFSNFIDKRRVLVV